MLLLAATKLLRDSNKNLEYLFGGYPIGHFLVFTPSVRVKHFWVDLDGMACCSPTPNVGVVHMWVVCM